MAGPAHIAVEVDRGRARLTRLDHGEFVAVRLLDIAGPRARVALLASCATLLSGDHVDVRIDVGTGAVLELVEPTGTVAYNTRGGRSSWRVHVALATDAVLVWPGAPFVVAGGAQVHRTTEFDLAEGARALVRELLVLGRTHEVGGSLLSSSRAAVGGRPLLVEDLDLTDCEFRTTAGILGDHRVLATALLLGVAAPADPERTGTGEPSTSGAARTHRTDTHLTDLAGPGALARSLGQHAHSVDEALDPVWHRWCRAVATAVDHGAPNP